jgi:hypothetical protein
MSDEHGLLLRWWVIYDHPSDYPDEFVAREWLQLRIGLVRTGDVRTAPSLDAVRELLPGDVSHRFPADPEDDPCIVESWI